MNFYVSESEIDRIIEEDISIIDLTSFALELKDEKTEIRFKARNLTMLSGVEEVLSILKKLNISVISYKASGTLVEAGEEFICGMGNSSDVQIAWRTCGKILEYFSGVATRAYHFVNKAKKHNPEITVATTRKNIPGTKKLAIKSIICGGAIPHRLGLSETILVFNEHMKMMGGLDKFIEKLPELKIKMREKKIGAEAHTPEDGYKLVEAGVDFVQLDKFSIELTKDFVVKAKQIKEDIIVVATGNITMNNVEDYAATGADLINTSCLYHGKPADIKIVIQKV
jgi:molybdenum transport protein